MSERHDMQVASASTAAVRSVGRNVIAVIGIDRYHDWPGLTNAVRDATGASALFRRLGFEQVVEPLLDEHATGKAIQSLVTDDLLMLGTDDSLVLFYAGHGGTRKHYLGDKVVKTGYLIPVDASGSQDKVSTWINLEGWLHAVSLLPAKHILVVLDACHSGIALDPSIKWRDIGSWQDTPLWTLKARRSRRIITSALDDQVALDSGPVHGHSLFTGCLMEGLTDGIRRGGHHVTTGSELGLYVQRRVQTYPNSRQTPDFGTFGFDERGEMVIPLAIEAVLESPEGSVAAEGLPAWFDLIDLDDTPDGVSEAESSRTHAESEEVEVGAPESASADPTQMQSPASQSEPDVRRWVIVGVLSTTLVTALIMYLRFGHEVSSVDPRVATPPAGDCSPEMVPVPAGTFRMGSPEGVGTADEHPQHRVTLPAYCIDKAEVTVKAYAACVAAKICSIAPLTLSGRAYSALAVRVYSRFCNRDDHPDHPINCVDWMQAAAYCTWVRKRLPSEAEWEYAACGSDSYLYPWGDDDPSGKRLNVCGGECAAMVKRNLRLDWAQVYDVSDGWETTAPVGSFPRGASPFGVLDMAGNVWEWTADWYDVYSAANAADPRGAREGTARVVRGGSWASTAAGDARTAGRHKYAPATRAMSVGFRCARGRD